MAEVLIVLGIIGVVAAMTISNLVTKYQKANVETKLKKFNSVMLQAIELSANDHGDVSGWMFDQEIFGNAYNSIGQASYEENKKYIEKYISPYLKIINKKKVIDTTYDNKAYIQLLDGTAITFNYQSDITSQRNLVLICLYIDGNLEHRTPRNMFAFMLDEKGYIKPFDVNWNNDMTKLSNDSVWGCKSGVYNKLKNGLYCTKLIQLNNWKIPSDYPW